MIVHNEDIADVIAEIPEGHHHIRTTITLKDGNQWTFQEAAIAGIVRAYVNVKTHPTTRRVVLRTEQPSNTKPGYAEWQLMEER